MRKFFVSVVTAVFLVLLSGLSMSQAADPEPSAYTLDNIYYYLAEGTEASWGAHSLGPQSGEPGDDIEGFTKSLEDIYYYMADAFNHQSKATYAMIASNLDDGYYFFCTDTNYWGLRDNSEYVVPWELNETTCNALTGWSWLNGACWSDAIADSVSWNKGEGDDTSNTGTYEPNTAGDLESRMEAVVAGHWSEICTSINGVSITTGMDGATGKPNISAMAIADCVDGTRDIGPTITGDWVGRSAVLDVWARAAGHSALPAVDYNGGNNEYEAACSGNFYLNQSTLSPDTNYCWAAACGSSSGFNWSAFARQLGYNSCAVQVSYFTSGAHDGRSFRVVVRPAAE